MIFSRRVFFLLAADVWKDKKADEWSEKDVQRLLTHSPWAKEVAVEVHTAGMESGGRSGGRGGRGGGDASMGSGGAGGVADGSEGMAGGPGGGGGGRGGARGGAGGGEGGPAANRPEMKAIVRWESARPVREATHKQLPEQLAGNYVISVLGLRLPDIGAGPEAGNLEERVKSATQLQRKGRDPIRPARVQMGRPGQGPLLIFIFLRGSQPIEAADKDVVFHIALGRMELKAKFALKDMMYHGELAL